MKSSAYTRCEWQMKKLLCSLEVLYTLTIMCYRFTMVLVRMMDLVISIFDNLNTKRYHHKIQTSSADLPQYNDTSICVLSQ